MVSTLTAAHPLLTREQEITLAATIRAGVNAEQQLDDAPPGRRRQLERDITAGIEAQHLMLKSNIRLALWAARRHPTPPNVPFDDVVSAAIAGLRVAIRKYDPGRGTRLSTAAGPWMMSYMQRACQTIAHVIHVPENILQAVTSGQPDSSNKCHVAALHALNMSSLDQPAHLDADHDNLTLASVIADDADSVETIAVDRATASNVASIVNTTLSRLDEKAVTCWKLHVGYDSDPMPASAISRTVNLGKTATRHAIETVRDELRFELERHGITAHS